tara:strand:- start:7324 stop:7821 length:498 start_codon:yes stop_codon:yes gene_type:complete
MAVLFCNEDKLKSSTAINYNVDTAFLLPFLKVAQDKNLQVILGTDLYNALEDKVTAGTLADDYKILVDDYIQDAIIHYALVEALPYISFQIKNGTITQKNSENGNAASKEDVNWLIQKERDTAEFYGQRIVDYLCENSSKFPEYTTNTGADLNPISNAYYTGIKL